MDNRNIIRELGEDLILRRSTFADTEALADFNTHVHTDDENNTPSERVGVWVRDLMSGMHPTFPVSDFTIVEERSSGKIVSSLNLITQTWAYDGIPFKVGRPELVGTLPEYRKRGLVRAQFDEIHQWSAERGELVQAITGIPFYYRNFGYEMALNLGGGRAGFLPQIPKLKDGEEPFTIRAAIESDIPIIKKCYAQYTNRSLISCVWDDTLWKYELTGKSSLNINRVELNIIVDKEGNPVGALATPNIRWGSIFSSVFYEMLPGISWAEVTPSVIRFLKKAGEEHLPEFGDDPWGSFGFWLGEAHPVYQLIRDSLPRVRKSYAWYIRVPDLPSFIQHISPVLEKRLAASPLTGTSKELKITFYRSGLRLVFEKGSLKQVDNWQPNPHGHSGDAAFPGLTFLQLLFGYRSLEELSYAYADCQAYSDGVRALLEILFPRQPSDIWPIS